MFNIALAKKVEYEKGEKPNQARIIIEPLHPGYGMTLGNSIRRVLLSSLLGGAAVGVKIKNVEHEFMTLPHLKEDILEFILNLKQIRLKVFSDETVKLELSVHGEKEIKAGDIKKNNLVEIVNPDQVIGHITDMSGNLDAEIYVKQGMGYEMIENRENKNNEIGYIEMDSIFSPIVKVGVEVSNVRVGKMTNWDRLILDIVTDGTITPEESFKKSVEILIDQFNALIAEKEAISEDNISKEKIEDDLIPETVEKEKDETEEITEKKKKRGRPKKTD